MKEGEGEDWGREENISNVWSHQAQPLRMIPTLWEYKERDYTQVLKKHTKYNNDFVGEFTVYTNTRLPSVVPSYMYARRHGSII